MPGVLLGCMTGVSENLEEHFIQEWRRSWDQSPYMRRIVILPYLDSSLRIPEIYLGLTLSESINRAILRSSIIDSLFDSFVLYTEHYLHF